ncbi:MAG: DUF4062 domain-containing protein [Desulfobacteraceae bacterium]|nr:DUF4062 domain-containing protein [Desulfobacteraceae bacterium]
MKRYIVFVSSTETDLKKERRDLIRTVIELEHMPASMEYFPASNNKSWSHIQRVIAECDYYVLILAGMYGSIDPETGLSFTEREFRYAREIGVPTIAFLHATPDSLPYIHHDDDAKLQAFYKYVKDETLCKFWSNSGELASKATTSLVKLISDNPRSGWVKANGILLGDKTHPVSRFLESNILPLLSQPYRENVEAHVAYSETGDPESLRVVDEVSYKCRSVGGSIDKAITWSFEAGEYQEMRSISIKIKKPTTGEEEVILHKEDFKDVEPEAGFSFRHEVSNDLNVDNLLVTIKADYIITFNHFVSWEMPKLTNGFALTITYTGHLNIFHMPYLISYKDNKITRWNGFFSCKFFTCVLPNEGLGWQFFKEG